MQSMSFRILKEIMIMNFKEFYENVEKMKTELENKNIDFEDVKIGYTKSTGENIIVALKGDYNVVSYFKW
jgi:DNA-binding protein YbaB